MGRNKAMPINVTEWMNDMSNNRYIWYVKRLSGNDTLANGAHQAGPYIPKELIFKIFPSMLSNKMENQERWFDFYLDSHQLKYRTRAIWYNNKFWGGTRHETRVTNFGGKSSPALDPENTGAIAIFAFELNEDETLNKCHCWIADGEKEEIVIEERIGEVEPGRTKTWSPDSNIWSEPEITKKKTCALGINEIPSKWLETFPSGIEIIRKSIALRPSINPPPDKRIIERRECEYEVFRSLEEAIEMPHILKGFSTLDEFVQKAQSILQRRKSRSGRSLELHLQEIFIEEGLIKGSNFSHQPTTEGKKKPDFIFPSVERYHDSSFPETELRMLAVKTTCKDRWRQILNEANRIKNKHLLTLQEGISIHQFEEIQSENVQLVVPEPLIKKYAKSIRPKIQTLESFIEEMRSLRK